MARKTHLPPQRIRRDGARTITRHTRSVCPQTGKLRLRDSHQAAHALRSTRWSAAQETLVLGSTRRAETRAYKCPDCNGFHLTREIYRTSEEWRDHVRLRAAIEQAEASAAETEREAILASERRAAAALMHAASRRVPPAMAA